MQPPSAPAAEANPPTPPPSRQREFWSGAKDELPILLGVAPFGVIFGALAMGAGLSMAAAQAMSSVIFAGSAQFIAVQLIHGGASAVVILTVVFVVNLRHALYSASLAPYLQHLTPAWKTLLSYLLTDEAYAVTVMRFQRGRESPQRHWYFLGAGLTLWLCWQISTAVGILIGDLLPKNLPLSFALPLTFIALVAPALKGRAEIVAAAVAALAGLLTISFPYKTGILLAALAGILAGMAVEAQRK
ncbi:MAG: AzlC family ABC transporter permease [Anaerolineae bacterium]|nr:AzlC family ABC transporter permease [Anaerolineae bacterium]